MTVLTDLTPIQHALDAESWRWLQDADDDIARALELTINRGATAADIRRFVRGYTDRDRLARRMEQAARYLTTARQEKQP